MSTNQSERPERYIVIGDAHSDGREFKASKLPSNANETEVPILDIIYE